MTNIHCKDCGHIRETTEEYPTLVACEECGSPNIEYTEMTNDITGLDEYQAQAEKTAIFPNELPDFLEVGQVYTVLGEAGETGEIAEKLKKAIREDDEQYIEDMRSEVGDTLWYLSQVCEEFDWSLERIAQDNLDKLQDRQERGQLTGEGDNR